MLESALKILVAPGSKSDDKKTEIGDVLSYIKLLEDSLSVDPKEIFGSNSGQSE